MEIRLSADYEEQLACMAEATGRSAVDLAREAVERFLDGEAVLAGREAGGDAVPDSVIWETLERALQI